MKPRAKLDVPVRVLRGKRDAEGTLRDVSSRGLLVSMRDPPPVRQLVKIELVTPHDTALFTSHATVVRVAKVDAETHAVGLELFGLDRAGLDSWEALVRWAAHAHRELSEPMSERKEGDERRRHPRFGARLEMRVRTPRNIHVAFSTDLAQGGVFFASDDDLGLELGETVVFNIVRPESRASIRVAGKIMHRRKLGTGMGYGAAFDAMPAAHEQEMLAFVTAAVEYLEHLARASLPPAKG